MPLRGPDTSSDVRLGAVSEETAGSDGSEPLAKGLSCPLGNCMAIGAASTAAYVIPPFGELVCRPPEACLLVVFSFRRCCGDEPAPVAGRRVAGSEESLASSVAFRFPADVRCDAVVPRFRVGTTGRFFFPMAAISALKNPGEKFPLDRVLMKACCSPSA
jgi:hypothetical protein